MPRNARISPARKTAAPARRSTTCAWPALAPTELCRRRPAAGALAIVAAALGLLSTVSFGSRTDIGLPGASLYLARPGQDLADKQTPSSTPFSHSVPPSFAPAVAAHTGPALAIEGGSSQVARPQVGLRVHPPVAWMQSAIPGEEVALPAPITIENCGRHPILCSIAPIRPSSIGIRHMSGYTDIPDPTWCKAGSDTLTLQPGESRAVEIKLSIPYGPCNFNRSWCVAFSVQTAGGGSLGAAAYPYVYIETSPELEVPRPSEEADGPRALPSESPRGTGTLRTPWHEKRASKKYELSDVGGQPEEEPPSRKEIGASTQCGCVIVGPGSIDAGDVAAGTTARAGTFTLKNGYDEDVRLVIKPLVPPDRGVARKALITPGHMWVEDTGWLRAGTRSLLLTPGEEAEVDVEVASPGDPSKFNFRWEGYVEVDGPWGPVALIRVRWRTTAPSLDLGLNGGARP